MLLTEVGQGGCVKQGLVLIHGPVLLKNTRTYEQEGINHFMNYVCEILPLLPKTSCAILYCCCSL